MGVMDEVVDDLAVRALTLEEKTGDETAIRKIADALASSSPTMEETFLTAVRIRRAERRARKLLEALERGETPERERGTPLPPQQDDH
jgi:hypothetical protein